MNALDALRYMSIENNIVGIREVDAGINISEIGKEGLTLLLSQSDSWEIGWTCDKCEGNGVISIPCPMCSGRSLHSLLEHPCCGGVDEIDCPCCTDGVRWEKEY